MEAGDMMPEAVAVKLMWALGQSADREKVMELFETPVQWDVECSCPKAENRQ